MNEMNTRDELDPATCTVSLPGDLCEMLALASRNAGLSEEQLIERALRRFLPLDGRSRNVYLSAPMSALLKGVYEENTTLAEIKMHGDFGVGTFNDLDGEMILLDGQVYQLKDDGIAHPVSDSVQTPFACVTFFDPTTIEDVEGELDHAAFKNLLYRLIPSVNMFYAIRIEGTFPYVKVWSVPRQENHRPIQEVTPRVFEYHETRGTVIGFYTPEFIKSLASPGYHLHFLNSELNHGGHLHECRMSEGRISLQFISTVELNLPVTLDYLTANLI